MPISTSIDLEKMLITYKVNGRFIISEFDQAYVDVLDDKDFDSSMNTIWDFVEANISEVSTEVMGQAIQIVQKYSDRRGLGFKVAFVAPDEVSYGVIRMFEVYGQDLGFDMMSFRNLDDANIWLET